MTNRNVLISGAGIAGLALAHWLRRYGFRPTVVERAPGLRHGGQAIDIRGTARQVVERMGLLDAIRQRHTGTHGIKYIDRTGKAQAHLGGDAFGDSGGVVAEIEILRGDLVHLLRGAAGPETEYLFGDHITALAETADGVDVTFKHAPPRRFALVVGADGLRSGVRAQAFGPEASGVRDLGYYTAFYPARSPIRFDGWELMYNMPAGNGVGGRVALVYPIRDTGEVRVMLSFVGPRLATEPRDPEAQKSLLRKVFSGGGWRMDELLAELAHTDDVYFDRATEVRLEHWARGRSVLLGDAAFGGSLGMGTSMALVGAYVLAGELATARDHTSALAGYEEQMRPYVAVNQKRPPGGTRGFAPNSATGIWLRNQVTRRLMLLPGKQKMMGDIQKAANAITLKDYRPAPVAAEIDG